MLCRLESFDLTPDFNVDVWGCAKQRYAGISKEEELEKSYEMLSKHYESFNFRFLQQVHGIDSIFVDPSIHGLPESIFWGKADAAFSSQRNVVLGVRVADCIPIVFADKDGSFCGVIHAGWRGLRSHIIISTLEHIEIKFGQGKKSNIKFWVGPHIQRDSYEIGEDVSLLFSSVFLKPSLKPEKQYLNLTKVLRDEFMKCEINDSQVIWNLQDTYGSNDYYSHRRGDIGRNVIVVYHNN